MSLQLVRTEAERIRQLLEERQAQFLQRLPAADPKDEWLDVSDLPGAAVFAATPFVVQGESGRWYARAS